MDKSTQIALAEKFRALHHAPEMLILPNAWDAGSAVIFEKAGFSAIGTTSAGIAYALGYPDGQQISLDDVLQVTRQILRRIHVPLTVDIESGYGAAPDEAAANIWQIIEAGAVGVNFEDALPDDTMIPLDTQVERIRALAALKTATGIPFYINARTDIYLLNVLPPEQRFAAAVERCMAYMDAGADGVFVPGAVPSDEIHRLVRDINAPLNILALAANPGVAELQALGVHRLSLGSGAARAAFGLTQKIAAALTQQKSLDAMYEFATPYADMNRLFG